MSFSPFFEEERAEPQVKMFNQLSHSQWDKVVHGVHGGLCMVATTNQCGFSAGADNGAFLQACVIKQRRVSPHLTHCDALSASAQLEWPCFVLSIRCNMTDMLLLKCSECFWECDAPIVYITIRCDTKLDFPKGKPHSCYHCCALFKTQSWQIHANKLWIKKKKTQK